MGGLHQVERREHILREGRDPPLRHIDMERHVLRRGGEPAILRVAHLHEIMKALLVEIEKLQRHAHLLADWLSSRR